jgi:putative Ca2+/H+ antiporter (TMEM165/GDT1 family)
MNLGNALVVFGAIFLAELPDKTMLATLMLSTRFRRRLPTWIGVSLGYLAHVVLAVTVGSALSRLPTTPVQLVVGVLFVVGGVWMLRTGEEHHEGPDASGEHSAPRIVWMSASVILVAEFADLTQLATAGFAARFGDPIAVGLGAGLALVSISGLAVLAGSWLATHLPMRTIKRSAAVVFLAIGVVTLATAF